MCERKLGLAKRLMNALGSEGARCVTYLSPLGARLGGRTVGAEHRGSRASSTHSTLLHYTYYTHYPYQVGAEHRRPAGSARDITGRPPAGRCLRELLGLLLKALPRAAPSVDLPPLPHGRDTGCQGWRTSLGGRGPPQHTVHRGGARAVEQPEPTRRPRVRRERHAPHTPTMAPLTTLLTTPTHHLLRTTYHLLRTTRRHRVQLRALAPHDRSAAARRDLDQEERGAERPQGVLPSYHP
eukprot:scaffold47625_cov32-Phaeocystis_antarctica.AAC.1